MSYTFWNILEKHKIEIPEIQRDYAQGRINKRIDAIRKGFVKDLLTAISFDNSINLDFVFGKSVSRANHAEFDKNKRSLEQMLTVLRKFSADSGVEFNSSVSQKPIKTNGETILIPYDGQQRLTTLFLLHFYIGTMARQDISLLKRFTYKTRESSGSFINKLIENNNILHEVGNEVLLSDLISDQNWFFISWKKDPTVSGMLVMLDEIKRQVSNLNLEEAWNNLISNSAIYFDFFDIKEQGFEEDLYVKMNARGKSLTDFENFRAWLEKKHKKTSFQPNDWIKKMDKEWLDLFWIHSNEDTESLNLKMMSFFKNMALLSKINRVNPKQEDNESDEDSSLDKKRVLIKEFGSNTYKYTPTSTYEEFDLFSESSMNFIFKILNLLSSDSSNGKLNNVIGQIWNKTFFVKEPFNFTEVLISDFGSLNLFHKSFIYSVLHYLECNEHQDISLFSDNDWSNFKDWIKVTRNLIYNSRIDDNTAYIQSINALYNLQKKKVLNIAYFIRDLSDENASNWITFFNTKQREEECKKLHLISSPENGLAWKQAIEKAENHFYLYGQIDFLLRLSESNIVQFKIYYEKFSNLFTQENLDNSSYSLQQRLFSISPGTSSLRSLGTKRYKFYKNDYRDSRRRDENWRHLFNDSKKTNVFELFLNENDNQLPNEKYEEKIELEKIEIEDWRRFIVHRPKVLKNCNDGVIKIDNLNNVRLLSKTLPFSKQWELGSYYFYLRQPKENVSPFDSLRYHVVTSQEEVPCAYYDNWLFKGVKYHIDCTHYNSSFKLKFACRDNENHALHQDIVNVLVDNHKFKHEENYLILDSLTYEKLTMKIEQILNSLTKLDNSTN